MKVIKIGIIVFGFLNLILFIINFFPKKDILENNKYLTISKIDNYYYENYDVDSKYFRLLSNDGVSSLNIYLVDSAPSNNDMYKNYSIYRSINYQILSTLNKYNEEKFLYDYKYAYFKNTSGNVIIENYIQKYDDKFLIISYSTEKELYDDNFINEVFYKIKVN